MRSQAERLRAARKAAGFKTARAACKRFNWNESTYRGHENGPREIGKDSAVDYARAFGVSLMWLITGTEDAGEQAGVAHDNPTPTRETQLLYQAIGSRVVPIVGAEAFDDMAEVDLTRLTEKARDSGHIAAKGMSDRVFLFALEDDGLKGPRFPGSPELLPGDLLVVDMGAPPRLGKPVLAKVRQTGLVIARLYGIEADAAGLDTEFVLSAKNEFYPEKQRYRKDQLVFRYPIIAVQRSI